MADIDIGPGAINRASSSTGTGFTTMQYSNPANLSGKIHTFEVWANTNISGFKIGTFYGSGSSWTVRDYESIGSVPSGSKQTFTGLDCDVQKDDILGAYRSGGAIERTDSGGGGTAYRTGDSFGGGTYTYTGAAGTEDSCYGTGAELFRPDAIIF